MNVSRHQTMAEHRLRSAAGASALDGEAGAIGHPATATSPAEFYGRLARLLALARAERDGGLVYTANGEKP